MRSSPCCSMILAIALVLASPPFLPAPPPATAAEDEKLPKSLPPVIGTATVGPAAKDAEWTIEIVVPKLAWEVVGEVDPKKTWPALAVEVTRETRRLKMGGPSQLAPSRVVDLQGRELDREAVSKRLAKETPVLVSVSGEMIDPYYLALTRPDTLIVILGPRDGMPAPELLPAGKPGARK